MRSRERVATARRGGRDQRAVRVAGRRQASTQPRRRRSNVRA